MADNLAIIAGRGALPLAIAEAAGKVVYVTFDGMGAEVPEGVVHVPARFERLGEMFAALRANAVSQVVFAGAMHRVQFASEQLDDLTARILPALAEAMGQGDDALLRHVIALFEAQGLVVRAASEVAPDLLLAPGAAMGRAPSEVERADARRGLDILTALDAQDVAQAVVIEAGLCLGIETLQGTDAMLDFVARTPAHLRRGAGVLVKVAKKGQDRRIDMPTIGPDTLRAVARAGLAGIIIGAGEVLVVEHEQVAGLIGEHDLFLATR